MRPPSSRPCASAQAPSPGAALSPGHRAPPRPPHLRADDVGRWCFISPLATVCVSRAPPRPARALPGVAGARLRRAVTRFRSGATSSDAWSQSRPAASASPSGSPPRAGNRGAGTGPTGGPGPPPGSRFPAAQRSAGCKPCAPTLPLPRAREISGVPRGSSCARTPRSSPAPSPRLILLFAGAALLPSSAWRAAAVVRASRPRAGVDRDRPRDHRGKGGRTGRARRAPGCSARLLRPRSSALRQVGSAGETCPGRATGRWSARGS